MNKVLIAIALLMSATLPSYGQNTSGSTPTPTAPNSGAGVQGMPGSKSGPAANSAGGTTTPQPSSTGGQDPSKVPGMPGSKSGPAAKSPNSK
jgi:hypothetical protein